MRSDRAMFKNKFFAVLFTVPIFACGAGVVSAQSAPGSEPHIGFGVKMTTLGWDPLESTCRHASLSIL